MNRTIPINLAVEGSLDEEILRKILRQAGRGYAIGKPYGRRGSGYLRKTIRGFNSAAKGTPFAVLTDLDQEVCPAALVRAWLPQPRHANLIFRVAVRAVEAWLLAHREGMARFLGIRERLVPADVDSLPNPKRTLIDLARQTRNRELRAAIVPRPGSTATEGPDYNGRLAVFVRRYWDVNSAARSSPSLARAVRRIGEFQPVWEHLESQ
ncbi:MAG: hypothetical protein ABSH05_25020 [Bryobacteraceae bacterium]|jgi:hypothetical protein